MAASFSCPLQSLSSCGILPAYPMVSASAYLPPGGNPSRRGLLYSDGVSHPPPILG